MSKLLARAKARFSSFMGNRSRVCEDDAYLDIACFDLQQSLEFCLKAIIELNGERYIQTHDIRAQINKLSAMQIEVPHMQEMRNMALTINSWEVESRYKDDFVASLEDVDAVALYVKDLIRMAENIVQAEQHVIDCF